MAKPSCKRIKYLIKDEREAAEEYHKLGYHGLEADERGHKEFFERLHKAKSCSTIHGGKKTMVSKKRSLAAKKAWRIRKRKYGKTGVKRKVRRKRK